MPHPVDFGENVIETGGSPNVKEIKLEDGKWYVFYSNDQIYYDTYYSDYRFVVDGDVNILICDGAIVDCKGITVKDGAKLTIWGQKKGSGKITCDASKIGIEHVLDYTAGLRRYYDRGPKKDIWFAGIGSESRDNVSTGSEHGTAEITINGGNIEAYGSEQAPGISCMRSETAEGKVIINGGTVKAQGGDYYSEDTWNDVEYNAQDNSIISESMYGSKQYADAIGCNYKHSGGTVAINDYWLIKADGKNIIKENRAEYYQTNGLRSSPVLMEVTECRHPVCTYNLTADCSQHIIHCKYCANNETVDHDYIYSTALGNEICKKCDYVKDSTPCKVTISQKYENGTPYTVDGGLVVKERPYALPECDTTPTGRDFVGWRIGDTDVVRSPGDEVRFETDTVVTAQYAQENHISGASLTLSGNIGVNIFIKTNSELDAKGYVTVEGPYTKNPEKKLLSSPEKNDTYGRKITYYLNAKDMGESITVRLYDENDIMQNFDGSNGLNTYTEYSYSPLDYFKVVKDGSFDDYPRKLKDLCAAMANYGEYARIYFGKTGGKICDPTEITDITSDDLSKHTIEFINSSQYQFPSALTYYGCSLLLKSNTTLRMYFKKNAYYNTERIYVAGSQSAEIDCTRPIIPHQAKLRKPC